MTQALRLAVACAAIAVVVRADEGEPQDFGEHPPQGTHDPKEYFQYGDDTQSSHLSRELVTQILGNMGETWEEESGAFVITNKHDMRIIIAFNKHNTLSIAAGLMSSKKMGADAGIINKWNQGHRHSKATMQLHKNYSQKNSILVIHMDFFLYAEDEV